MKNEKYVGTDKLIELGDTIHWKVEVMWRVTT